MFAIFVAWKHKSFSHYDYLIVGADAYSFSKSKNVDHYRRILNSHNSEKIKLDIFGENQKNWFQCRMDVGKLLFFLADGCYSLLILGILSQIFRGWEIFKSIIGFIFLWFKFVFDQISILRSFSYLSILNACDMSSTAICSTLSRDVVCFWFWRSYSTWFFFSFHFICFSSRELSFSDILPFFFSSFVSFCSSFVVVLSFQFFSYFYSVLYADLQQIQFKDVLQLFALHSTNNSDCCCEAIVLFLRLCLI